MLKYLRRAKKAQGQAAKQPSRDTGVLRVIVVEREGKPPLHRVIL